MFMIASMAVQELADVLSVDNLLISQVVASRSFVRHHFYCNVRLLFVVSGVVVYVVLDAPIVHFRV